MTRSEARESARATNDVLELTRALVDVPSVSGEEDTIADLVEQRLRSRAPHLRIDRVGNEVVARTMGGRQRRLMLAGHLDTVAPHPGTPSFAPDSGRVRGLGATDMKGGLAVMLMLAERSCHGHSYEATFVFASREELGSNQSGMRTLFDQFPELMAAHAAVVLEPSGGRIEAGCQGNLVLEMTFAGRRAHTARPWRGSNAIHQAAAALQRIAEAEVQPVLVEGLPYRQALSVVGVAGGVQGNVVPDQCTVRVNYRHAPSIGSDAATAFVAELAPEAAEIRTVLSSPPAPPRLDDPILSALQQIVASPVAPKLGWTEVGRLAQHGIPAANFGPGDPELAHGPDERVSRFEVEQCLQSMAELLGVDCR